uniref:UDENN domain-containing protein n=1 Tax=Mesocestoides corti TaxID=53468 RepID=A0A5K3FXK5_MESCO
METLKSLAIAKPMDQPALPADSSPVSHHEGFSNEKLVRSSFGRPVNTTLHPLSTLTEVHVDKMPIVRKISIQRLPQHLLPSSMSFEAISSITSIDDRTTDRSSTYAKRKTFNRQPTFITNPFQLATSDTVDWVCNDLAYIDVVFDNPFAIPLSLDEMCGMLGENTVYGIIGSVKKMLNRTAMESFSRSLAVDNPWSVWSGCVVDAPKCMFWC